MEVLFKIVYVLCLSCAVISIQFISPLNANNPDLDFLMDKINSNIHNQLNARIEKRVPESKECFCLPKNENSQPVTSNLERPNEDIQRLVVYLYKNNGVITVFVPNRIKQDLIPELNFDENDGDILKPVYSESIADVFNSDIVKPQKTIIVPHENEEDSENSAIQDMNEQEPNINLDDHEIVNEVDEYVPLGQPDNDITVEVDHSYSEENTNIDNIPNTSLEYQQEANNNLDQLSPTNSLIEPEPLEINNDGTIVDPQELGIISNLEDNNNQDKDNNNQLNKITNVDGYDGLIQIFSPQNTQSGELSQQNQYTNYVINNPYITFNDWFDLQLKRIVLYNLQTESKVIQLKIQIQNILQNNGMSISMKGIVTDSNRQLVRMNNIKLRPILIGRQFDPQNIIDQTGLQDTIAYVQLIEVILVSPPKLLGTLVLGTVYLPRNINAGRNVNTLNDNKEENVDSKNLRECPSCSSNNQFLNSRANTAGSGSSGPGTLPELSYGPYYALPFRRKIVKSGSPFEEGRSVNVAPRKRINQVVSKSRDGVFNGLFGNLAPFRISNPNRRILGGKLPKGSKPGPQTYPNDVLPGYRIIGGNAATSSGTPLVNKGRSGFRNRTSHLG